MSDINLPLILLAALLASASPGPATLTIAGTSMTSGRRAGLAVATGVTTGSLTWSISAAFGLGAIMLANAWLFEIIRYAGAAYLGCLAIKSARAAWLGATLKVPPTATHDLKGHYAKGLALHLTNPKAILFFGALYSVGVPPGTPAIGLLSVILAVGALSFTIFHGYALIFSSARMMRTYVRAKRGFEAAFALFFGAAALRILTAKLT
ncbi:LysE family translocator [Tateyamaria sp.]|uniref:LysE family translocator n=1 Tax=Tateyamaria sp. TaxID=1929288 RepID=UPI00329C4390